MSLIDNISFYYNLNGNSNKSFGSNNGSDTNVTYSTGRLDQGAVFNGTTSKILVPDSTDFTFGSSDFSVSCWIKRSSFVRQVFLGQVNGAGVNTSISFTLQVMLNGTVVGTACVGSTASQATSTTTINDSNWHHIVFLRDSGTMRLYIDSVADGTAAISGSVNDAVDSFGIGCAGSLTNLFFSGTIDEVGGWKRKLTTSEISQLYAGITYPFNQGKMMQFFLQ